MGKWDGKRQAARRASRPQGAASAVADRRVRPEAEPPCGPVPAFCANFGQGSRPGSLPGKGLGKVDAGGQAKRGRAAASGKSNAKWRACSLLGMGLLQGVGRPKGASAPPKPAALPPRPSCGRPALRAPRPRGNSAKIQGYFGSRPSRRQVASRLCCSCAR